jgi:tetratricopeptide (TPR) repeat protein
MMRSVARRLWLTTLFLSAALAPVSGQNSASDTATHAAGPGVDRARAARADSAPAPRTDSQPRLSTETLAHDSSPRAPVAADSLRDRDVADSSLGSAGPQPLRVEELIREGDAAMGRLEPEPALEAYQAAVELDPSSYEAPWKAGRTLVAIGDLEQRGNPQKDLYNKALKYAERAVKVNPSGAEGHLVRAFALDRVGLFEGGKTKIRLAREVRAEAQRAIDLDPLLDEAYHVLGEWNYKLADMGFVSRLVTKTLLGGMPDDVSFRNAAHYFELAIQANSARLDHHLAYARTLMRLDRKDDARVELQKVLQLPARELGDSDRKEEARQLLERLS